MLKRNFFGNVQKRNTTSGRNRAYASDVNSIKTTGQPRVVLSLILLTRFWVQILALAKKSIARLANSTFAFTVAGLCAVELFVRCANPLSWFDQSGLTTHNNRFVTKLPLIMESSEKDDVLLVGA